MTSRMPARTLLAAAIATTIAAAPAGASASTYRYDVTVKTTVDYKLHKAWGNAKNGGDRHYQFSSDLYSELRGVQFSDGVIEPFVNGAPVDENTFGFYSAEDRSQTSPTKHLRCEPDPEKFSPWGRSSLEPMGPGKRMIALRVTDKLQYDGNCDDGRSPGYGITSIDGAAEDYDGPFDQIFELPLEAIGQGKIIQRLDSVPVNSDTCPGYDEQTTSCTFSWSAELTFLRTDLRDLPPMPLPTPAPPTPPTPSPASTDNLVRHVTDAIRDYLDEQRIAESIARAFRDSHKQAKVQLDCPGPCSGTVSAYTVASAKSAPSGKPLATATFRSVGGGSRLAARSDDAESVLAKWKFDTADRRALGTRRYVALKFAMRTGADPTIRRATLVLKIGR